MKNIFLVVVLLGVMFVGCGDNDVSSVSNVKSSNIIEIVEEKKEIVEEVIELTALEKELNSCYGEKCYLLAYAYYIKEDNSLYIKEILALMNKSCDEKSASGCLGLGGLYYDDYLVLEDRRKSYDYLDRAYELLPENEKNSILVAYSDYAKTRG